MDLGATTASRLPALAAPFWIVALTFAGALSALAGGYWDDAWHTERGRDSFFIAPHLAIYLGVGGAGGALTLWAVRVARRIGPSAILRHKPLTLALLSVGVTLASGPIDNAWHLAFGRDAVIWSPPHMLGIAGTLALGAALLADLSGHPAAAARPLTIVAGALVLAASGFSVAEYDTDVPQFDEVFYLPVLGFAASFGLGLVRIASDQRWAATPSAAVYTAFIVGVSAFLALADFPPPALPLLVLPAVVVDVAFHRRWHPTLAAAVFTLALHTLYVPVRNLLGDGVRFDAADVGGGLALTWLATLVVFGAARGERPGPRRPVGGMRTAGAAGVLALILASSAVAHDPGQGDDGGDIAMRVVVADQRASLTADLPPAACDGTEARFVVARRAGEMLRAPLTKRGCRLQGTLRLPEPGRWFVYAEMRRDGRALESWLPVSVEDGAARVLDARRYAYVPPREDAAGLAKTVGGIVLYGAMAALLYTTLLLIRSSRRERDALDPRATPTGT